MAKGFFWFLLAAVALMVMDGLAGCSHRATMPPVVVTQTSLQSDSLVRSLFSLLVSERKEVRTDSFVRTERYFERTTVNENGDTLRHDTRSEISTEQYQALEKENKVLQMRIDSLEHVKCRVDSVPVPYKVEVPVPVERELSWWQRTQLDAFFPLVICVAALIAWSFLRRKFNFNK
ncbi:MAG: hypothetical protein HDS35_00870 [Bacteroides sp.]|nr:hypothetical protein [Bacteroides sp.]